MTASTGFTGRGVVFEVSNGASPTPVWTAIANVRSANLSGRESEEIDFTHLASSGGYREFRQGFKDGGNIQLEIHYDPADPTHQDILEKFNSGELFEWRINYSAAGKAYGDTGTGYISNPGDITIDPENPVGGTATVRVTGESTVVAIP